jgi:hypothetical protein
MGQNAREANRRIGERMVADEVRWLGDKAAELLAAYNQNRPQTRRPLSFTDIEAIWAAEVLPRLKGFKSMQHLERMPPPAGSRWQLNYQIPEELS